MEIKWIESGRGNLLLEADWGYISYNPDTGQSDTASFITDLLNIFENNFEDGEETALYDGKIWRVLTGDFRKQYEKAFPDIKKCLEVYKKNKKHRNNYSTD